MKIKKSLLIIAIFLVIIFLTSLFITNHYFSSLKVLSCFGPGSKTFSYNQYVKEIQKNEQVVLASTNKDYFNYSELQKSLYYNVWVHNKAQVLISVSNPKYEKMHKAILIDRNDKNFVINFGETKQIESRVKTDDLKNRDLNFIIPIGVIVAPNAVLKSEYNPVNGDVCIYAEPDGFVKLPIFINYFFRTLKFFKSD